MLFFQAWNRWCVPPLPFGLGGVQPKNVGGLLP